MAPLRATKKGSRYVMTQSWDQDSDGDLTKILQRRSWMPPSKKGVCSGIVLMYTVTARSF